MERLEATVHGAVQGVGFRWFVIRQAVRLRLIGWVANDPAGTVSLVAEGSRERLEELLRLLGEGPPGARVERVASEWLPASREFTRFDVRARGHGGD